ncbi:MAG: tetratricopeptide repeat protein [Solirubrobacteraceae bacterium]
MTPSDRRPDLVRVVVVSPGDVADERETVVSVVEELNRRVAPDKGVLLRVWRWETDARPGLHLEGPQGLIDERMEIAESDVVVGIFWKRFGTPTGDAQSGTEHELRMAWESWRQAGRPDVMVYFSAAPASPSTSTELEQWQRVLKFREQLPKEQLWWSYTTPVQFERLVRAHLEDVIVRRAAQAPPTPEPRDRPRAPVRFNLPLVPRLFVGRTRELAALEEALAVADRAVVSQAITGLGGVGKSRLAEHYLSAHLDEYDVVAWIRAEDGGVADLAGLAAAFGEPVDGLSPTECRDLAVARLGRGEERWLLVLDNIDYPAQLADCLPRTGNGRVLVTSRNREVRQFAPVLSLDVFDEQTAVEYLIERAGRPGDRAGAERVARALGYLPLALSHAAAYCAEGTSFADYLELLDALPAEELFDTSPEAFYTQTVASTWKASIEAASASAPLAGELLALAAHLGPDAIPKSLFNVVIDPSVALEQKRLRDGLNALARLSLASVDDDTVSVHRLLGKVVREDARARGDTSAGKRALAALDHAFPADPSDAARWPLSEQLLAHVIALADAAAGVPDTAAQVIALLNRASEYLIWAEGGARGLALAQRTVERATSSLGAEHPSTLIARNYEAMAYRLTGRASQAIALFQELLVDEERILGAEHPDTLTVRAELARAYGSAGRVPKAIAIYEPLLADQERILGADHRETRVTRYELAGAYHQDAGRVAEAISMFELLLADEERILGAQHPNTLDARYSLAVAYWAAGRVPEAIAILQPLLAERERIVGPTHPSTFATRNMLALAYQAAGRVGEAITIFQELLADKKRILGAEDPDTLSTRHNLAGAYQAAGARRGDHDLPGATRRVGADLRRRAPRHARPPRQPRARLPGCRARSGGDRDL